MTAEAIDNAASRLIARAVHARDAIVDYFDSDLRQTRDMNKSIDDLKAQRHIDAASRLETRRMEKAFNTFKQTYKLEHISTNPQKGDFGQSLGTHNIGGKEFHLIHNADTNKTFASDASKHLSSHPGEHVVFGQKHGLPGLGATWTSDHSHKNIEKQQVAERTARPRHNISLPKQMDHDHGIDM